MAIRRIAKALRNGGKIISDKGKKMRGKKKKRFFTMILIYFINLVFFFFQQQSNENGKTREVEVDIDELLDMDTDDHRRSYLQVLFLILVVI